MLSASASARPVNQQPSRRQVTLSDRQIETLTWAARGKTSAEIAGIVGVTKRTVDFHIDNARSRLGAATRLETVIKALSRKLIKL